MLSRPRHYSPALAPTAAARSVKHSCPVAPGQRLTSSSSFSQPSSPHPLGFVCPEAEATRAYTPTHTYPTHTRTPSMSANMHTHSHRLDAGQRERMNLAGQCAAKRPGCPGLRPAPNVPHPVRIQWVSRSTRAGVGKGPGF